MSGYRYGFNGKENDNEVKGEGNEQDYGMRVYDPRAGRFLSVDPLTQEYPWYTPYQFAGNTPMQAIDLDGAEEELVQLSNALKQKSMLQMDKAWYVGMRRQDHLYVRKPNWGEEWKAWNDEKSSTHTGAFFSRLGYNVVNDAKITYTTVVNGKNHASGIDNVGVTDYKERLGANLNTLSTIILPVVGEEIRVAMKLPQGINVKNFSEMSSYLKQNVGNISEDIVVQGSRASHTATATSDIDIAIKVDAEKFDELIADAFKNAKPNTARWRTMEHAIETGKITTGDAGLRGIKRHLQELLDMKVDLSVIKRGGSFDNGAQIPIKGAKVNKP